jgi:hypothetical protein
VETETARAGAGGERRYDGEERGANLPSWDRETGCSWGLCIIEEHYRIKLNKGTNMQLVLVLQRTQNLYLGLKKYSLHNYIFFLMLNLHVANPNNITNRHQIVNYFFTPGVTNFKILEYQTAKTLS